MSHIPPWVAVQLIYGEAIRDIENLFIAGGYHFMPIKGAYLIRTGLSSAIAERKMLDIDLMIPDLHFTEVGDWFGNLPGTKEVPNYWDFERSFLYSCSGYPVYVEFHRLLNLPARYILPNELLFKRGIPAGDSCILPDPTDALLIHLCHKLAHVIDGFDELFYREIGIYAGENGFSWESFWERAHATGILSFIWLVIDHFRTVTKSDTPLPPAPSLYARMLAWLGCFMQCDNVLMRRLLFEIPFVRNPWGLLCYKFIHNYLK